MKDSVLSLKNQQHNIGFSTFKFMTDPLNSVVDGLGILLVGYRIEFSCLYIPQGHYVISS